jgi:hypothetical protein|tara:strand:+ start:805 stop:1170 length:366 start_codon:yes stop_codon:yes gene_type:complete
MQNTIMGFEVIHTSYGRKNYGDKSFQASSKQYIDINGKKAVITMSTSKSEGRGLMTCVSVGFITAPGIVTTMIYGDFFKRIETNKVRCTEKAVREQHSRNVTDWGQVLEAIQAFYLERKAA